MSKIDPHCQDNKLQFLDLSLFKLNKSSLKKSVEHKIFLASNSGMLQPLNNKKNRPHRVEAIDILTI